MDYTGGDLYEAEELYRLGRPIRQTRLIFVQFPQGRVWEPVQARAGQYFGEPEYWAGRFIVLLADFPAGELRLLSCDPEHGGVEPVAVLPRSAVEDCYNLRLKREPLMLTRQTGGRFQVVWPEWRDYALLERETVCFRDGALLYSERWHEDPDWREEVLVRDVETGQRVRSFPGSLQEMPDGTWWILQ